MPLAERHTQTIIADQLGTIADQWKISGKISACHDGAASMKDVGQSNSLSDVTCCSQTPTVCAVQQCRVVLWHKTTLHALMALNLA